ncbi:MAG: protein kinase [Myxococcota bacterium]
MNALPQRLGLEVIEGPARIGSELRWRVQHEGRPALLAQLLPELAHDPAVRRRYVRDVERLRGLGLAGLAPTRKTGPEPDPRAPEAPPPWRLRDDPEGETLEHWLTRRAPAPVDEVARLGAALAELVHRLHGRGAVVRNLDPSHVVLAADDRLWLTDVGLARVDVLSTRTAASLILEGSPYTAPELLTETVVDQRADLYGLGTILFRAVTGMLPYGDSNSLLRPTEPPPRASTLRPDIPAGFDELIARCLDHDPAARPDSAAQLAEILGGRSNLPSREARVPCQECGTPLRPGQRLCTHCGKLAVQFVPATTPDEGHEIVLRKIDEGAEARAKLERILGAVSDGPLPPLNFVVGDARMYSKGERKAFITLPARLVSGLSESSAHALNQRLADAGLHTRVVAPRGPTAGLAPREKRGLAIGAAASVAAILGAFVLAVGEAGLSMAVVIAGVMTLVAAAILVSVGLVLRHREKRKKKDPVVALRPTPAALPASDPLVARLAALLTGDPPPDLREQVGELALAVQRLVDHRAHNRAEADEIDAVTAPVAQLVSLIEGQVQAIRRIDLELGTLDEGALVRALAAAEARGDAPAARETLLEGLDRLRALEDARARRFHRLLEATHLARRSVELGLAVHDGQAEHERHVAQALAALERELGEDVDASSSPAALPAAAAG